MLGFFCLISSSFHPIFYGTTEKPIALDLALNKGMVGCEIASKGGYKGDCAKVTLSNKTNHLLNVELESGRNLVSLDTTKQDLMNVDDVIFVLEGNSSETKPVFAFCSQSSKSAPEQEERYVLGEMHDKNSVKLANYLSENKSKVPVEAMQSAVWVLTDNRRIEGIYHEDRDSIQSLLAYVAGLTYKVTPWYGIEYEQQGDSLISNKAKTIYGNFEANLNENEVVKLVVYNMFNVDQIRKTIKTGRKGYNHPVSINVKDLKPGRYSILFITGGGRVDEKVFTI